MKTQKETLECGDSVEHLREHKGIVYCEKCGLITHKCLERLSREFNRLNHQWRMQDA